MNLLEFLSWFFTAAWEFFKIPFPMLDMTVGQVFIGAAFISFSIVLLKLMLGVRVGHIPDRVPKDE